ncbi:hypothetical protein HDU92_002627 [Lobulomyces angularis]|nr:hypothetical protein HDU92_002627 [Lobulomyces angularis]
MNLFFYLSLLVSRIAGKAVTLSRYAPLTEEAKNELTTGSFSNNGLVIWTNIARSMRLSINSGNLPTFSSNEFASEIFNFYKNTLVTGNLKSVYKNDTNSIECCFSLASLYVDTVSIGNSIPAATQKAVQNFSDGVDNTKLYISTFFNDTLWESSKELNSAIDLCIINAQNLQLSIDSLVKNADNTQNSNLKLESSAKLLQARSDQFFPKIADINKPQSGPGFGFRLLHAFRLNASNSTLKGIFSAKVENVSQLFDFLRPGQFSDIVGYSKSAAINLTLAKSKTSQKVTNFNTNVETTLTSKIPNLSNSVSSGQNSINNSLMGLPQLSDNFFSDSIYKFDNIRKLRVVKNLVKTSSLLWLFVFIITILFYILANISADVCSNYIDRQEKPFSATTSNEINDILDDYHYVLNSCKSGVSLLEISESFGIFPKGECNLTAIGENVTSTINWDDMLTFVNNDSSDLVPNSVDHQIAPIHDSTYQAKVSAIMNMVELNPSKTVILSQADLDYVNEILLYINNARTKFNATEWYNYLPVGQKTASNIAFVNTTFYNQIDDLEKFINAVFSTGNSSSILNDFNKGRTDVLTQATGLNSDISNLNLQSTVLKDSFDIANSLGNVFVIDSQKKVVKETPNFKFPPYKMEQVLIRNSLCGVFLQGLDGTWFSFFLVVLLSLVFFPLFIKAANVLAFTAVENDDYDKKNEKEKLENKHKKKKSDTSDFKQESRQVFPYDDDDQDVAKTTPGGENGNDDDSNGSEQHTVKMPPREVNW